MLRFITNFVLFGLLFYLIHLFFPDAFNTLVSWVGSIYEFLHDLVLNVIDRIKGIQTGEGK